MPLVTLKLYQPFLTTYKFIYFFKDFTNLKLKFLFSKHAKIFWEKNRSNV